MINPLKDVEINRFTLYHPAIPTALSGFSIAQITDVHLGRWVKPRHLAQLVAFVNEQHPQLVALTGDYVGYNKLDLPRCINIFDQLTAPTFAVLGNHDHWASTQIATDSFHNTHVTLLTNERRSLTHHDATIEIVGVDDAVTKHADVPAAFKDLPADRFCLALNHVPSIADQCIRAGAHLVLSGHTHGFQFNIPRLTHRIAQTFGTKFYAGPYRINDSFLYISRGLGSASWPRRLRAASELTFFTLQHAPRPRLNLDDSSLIHVQH
jgi:predicted MPP superfamily phosphohydrolase